MGRFDGTVPRDYKHRAEKKPARKPLPGWLWLLTGLLLGAFVMGLVWLRGQSEVAGGGWVGAQPERPPQAVPEKPEPKPKAVPRREPDFRFYDILANDRVPPKPGVEVAPRREPKPAPRSHRYLVQVGSFGSAGEADTVKARLILMGHDVRVDRAQVPGMGTRYRVRIGPYQGEQAARTVSQTLQSSGYDTALVRLDAG